MKKLKKTIPLKGEPYFGNISKENLNRCEELIQSLIFAYKNAEDKETVALLSKCHKDISNAITDEEGFLEEGVTSKDNPFKKKRIKKKSIHLTRNSK